MFSKLFKRLLKARSTKKLKKGVTLVELAVSIAIFAILSGVVFFNYGDFNSNLVMTNLAYEVGLFVRQAQVYGTSVLGGKQQGFDSQNFSNSYGISVDLEKPTTIVLFSDSGGDGFYQGNADCGENDAECVEKITMTRNVYVNKICVKGITSPLCSDVTEVNPLTITFKRPDPSANIRINGEADLYEYAEIYLISPEGKQRVITVYSTGQISIKTL